MTSLLFDVPKLQPEPVPYSLLSEDLTVKTEDVLIIPVYRL